MSLAAGFPMLINPREERERQRSSRSATRYANNIYESTGYALYHTLHGDPSRAGQALLMPGTLSPLERRRITDDFAPNEGVLGGILRTVTNPLVLIGAALAFRYPIMDPKALSKAPDVLARYGRWIPGPLRGLLGMHEIFQGTPIPRIVGRITAESTGFLERHFVPMNEAIAAWRKTAGRTETPRDMVRWALGVDPWWRTEEGLARINKQIKSVNSKLQEAGRGAERLAPLRAGQIRPQFEAADDIIIGTHNKVMEGIRNELASDPKLLRRMTAFMSRGQGIATSENEVVRWIEEGFFPRVAVRDDRVVRGIQDSFIENLLGPEGRLRRGRVEASAAQEFTRKGRKVVSRRLENRTGVLPPDARDLELLGADAVDSEALRSLRGIADSRAARGKVSSYSLRYSGAINHYAHSIARAFAWNKGVSPEIAARVGVESNRATGKGLGDLFLDQIDDVAYAETEATAGRLIDRVTGKAVLGGGMAKTELLRNFYLPAAMGFPNFQQTMKAMEWSGVRQAAWRLLDHPNVRAAVPETLRGSMRDYLASGGGWSFRGVGGKIATYFNLTALGLNVGSAFQNLLEPLMATGPVLGTAATMRGIAAVTQKLPKFAELVSSGMPEHKAIAKLFPEFAERALDLAPVSEELLRESASIARGGITGLGGLQRGVDRARDIMMSLFRGTEQFKRLSSFEAARLDGIGRYGMSAVEAGDFAQDMLEVTQMWANGVGIPSALRNWPAPLRQFLTYSSKLAGFMGASAFGLGGPFNRGTLGRALVGSAAAYEIVRSTTGADLSRGLLFGALPSPEESGPFAPVPIVPPVLGVAGAIGLDVARGEGFQETRRVLPLLVPGGLQAARIAQAYYPEAARAVGRTYAEPGQRGPDGRVPVYSASGQLIGHKTDMELLAGTMGIPGALLDGGGSIDESQRFKYLIAQRDQIRNLRQKYIEATLDNDLPTAEATAREHLTRYGVPVQVRPQDWESAKRRRMVPRIQQALRTVPEDVRPLLQTIAGAGIAGDLEGFAGL